ncbi:MAG: SH3 domain-containing protein [Lachnospiraceae bacterium]|nr:SH3 domain-containing protein [Lachnospiraceae bacterium]
MKKILKYSNYKVIRGLFIFMCAVAFFILNKTICFADATGKITAPSAKIRESADINSEVIASSSQGKTVNITAEITDASGTLWYEIYVDANTKGYIRSDLVQKDASSGTVPSSTVQSTTASTTTAAQETAPEPTASGAEIPAETEMPAQYASIRVPAAKIRGGASTTKGIVDTIPQNTQVVVSGQTNGSDGKAWYYITFTGTGGQEKTGYVRSDLVNLGDLVAVDESGENPVENPEIDNEQEPEVVNRDYEVVYEQTEDGGVWYLYNNLENKKQKLEDLMAAADSQEFNESVDSSTIKKQRIVIVIMIVVIILMAFTLTILFFKLRDIYYEAYEGEEEPEQEEYEKTRSNKRENDTPVKRTIPEDRTGSLRKKRIENEKSMPVKEVTYEEEPETQLKPAPKKKAKNFMIDDEEFEFEFLNMKK